MHTLAAMRRDAGLPPRYWVEKTIKAGAGMAWEVSGGMRPFREGDGLDNLAGVAAHSFKVDASKCEKVKIMYSGSPDYVELRPGETISFSSSGTDSTTTWVCS